MNKIFYSICLYTLLGIFQSTSMSAQPITCHGLNNITTFELDSATAIVTGTPGEVGTTYLYPQADPGQFYDIKVTVMDVFEDSPNGELYDPVDDEQTILNPYGINYHHFFTPIWHIDDGAAIVDYIGSHTYKFEFFDAGTISPASINVIATSVDNDGLDVISGKYREQVIYGSSPDFWLVHPDAELIISGNTITATDPPLNDPGLQATNQSAIGAYYSGVSEITWTSDILVNDFTPNANSFVRHSALSFVCESGYEPSQVLPIELLSFDVKREGKNSIISWSTHSEVNNDYFIIERSTSPGTKFTSVSGRIAGLDFTNEKRSYTFTDEQPGDGFFYYRLKQVDLDGTYSYSNIKSIHFDSSNKNFDIYPNPVLDELNLQFKNKKGEIKVEVFDMQGQPIYRRTYPEGMWTNSLIISAQNWEKGVYIIELTNQGYYGHKMFVKR